MRYIFIMFRFFVCIQHRKLIVVLTILENIYEWEIFVINVIVIIKIWYFSVIFTSSVQFYHIDTWIFTLFVELKRKKKSVFHFRVNALENNFKGKLRATLNSLEIGNCNKNWQLDREVILLICYLATSSLYPNGNSGV